MTDTAPPADDSSAPVELSQVEQDALIQAQEGVDGLLVPNTPVEDNNAVNDKDEQVLDKDTSVTGDDDSGDNSGSTGDSTGDTGAGQTDEQADSTKEAPVDKPAPQLDEKVEKPVDPGDFTPGDYSFEIVTTDNKTHKITSLEEAEAFAAELDENPELISASQFMALNRKTAVMERSQLDDKQTYDGKKATYDTQVASEALRNQTLEDINNGFAFLEAEGTIPKVAPELNTEEAGTRWATEYKDEPGVKERMEILQYMNAKNEKRIAAGLKPNFDPEAAYTSMQLDNIKKQDQDTVTKEKDDRRTRGSMVGGAATHNPTNVPEGTIIGPGGSLDDIVTW